MKYKYYFKQPRGAIIKDILFWLSTSTVAISAIVAPNALRGIVPIFRELYPSHKYNGAYTAFRRLLNEGSIEVQRQRKQIYISLTEKGRKKAGWLQINHLNIKKTKRWGGLWYIVIFDISHQNKFVREALRGFLKRLKFYQLQKSVWVCPYKCRDEIALLKDFFGLSDKELRLIVSGDIGHDHFLKKIFKL